MGSIGELIRQAGWRDDVTGRSGSPAGWQLMERSPCSSSHTHGRDGMRSTRISEMLHWTGQKRYWHQLEPLWRVKWNGWVAYWYVYKLKFCFFVDVWWDGMSLESDSWFLKIYPALKSVALRQKGDQTHKYDLKECLLLCAYHIFNQY